MLDQPVIKLVLLVSVVVVTAMLTRSTAGVRHQAVRRLLLVGFVVLAAIAILFPRVMTQVAQLLGVGRGADLLLYGLTVVFLGYVAASYRRMRQLEQQVTTLARELALRAAVHDTTEHDSSGHVGSGHETGYDESAHEDPAPDGGQTSRRSQS
ncbi:DUF2304 domain-containing protein [Serinicoccus profundi]|uniref:DUF2304 domain-containing protein n=1 Tax=Serinicoccus profundi TaxID=1078471 RepID=UPI000255F570|nr:DUF2304 domain-containing protein [Serinicoccus profundi]